MVLKESLFCCFRENRKFSRNILIYGFAMNLIYKIYQRKYMDLLILLTNISWALYLNQNNFDWNKVFAKTKNLSATKKRQHHTKPFALIYWSSFKIASDSYQHLLKETFSCSLYNQLYANMNKMFRFTWMKHN